MDLDPSDHRRLIEFYRSAYNEHGVDAKSLHWISRYNQLRRFEILSNIGDLADASVLDVGCGLGDLYGFLKERGIDVEYSEIDIMPEFIEAAKLRFSEAAFIEGAISTIRGTFDYCLASGALTFKVKNNERFYFEMIHQMYVRARRGVGFNMLDKATHADNEIYAAYSPTEVASYCESFCPHVQINIGYMPDDFTIYLYKNI